MEENSLIKKVVATTINENVLYNATDNVIGGGDTDSILAAQAELDSSSGWYIKLEGDGEKTTVHSLALKHQLFFTTYSFYYLPLATLLIVHRKPYQRPP